MNNYVSTAAIVLLLWIGISLNRIANNPIPTIGSGDVKIDFPTEITVSTPPYRPLQVDLGERTHIVIDDTSKIRAVLDSGNTINEPIYVRGQ